MKEMCKNSEFLFWKKYKRIKCSPSFHVRTVKGHEHTQYFLQQLRTLNTLVEKLIQQANTINGCPCCFGMMWTLSSVYLVLNVFVSPQVCSHLRLLRVTQQQRPVPFPSLHKQHHYTNTWGWSNVGALVSRWVKSGPTLGKLFLLTHNELLLDNESLNYLGKQSLSLGLAVWDGKMRDQLFYINLGYYLHNGDGHFFIFIVTVYTKMSKH